MNNQRRGRWLGEFVVIVLGVLVALAVDDWAQHRSDREVETDLLERLQEDLVADAADLALAQSQVARRLWLFEELERALRDGTPPLSPPDSLLSSDRISPLLEAAGRSDLFEDWHAPLEAPLLSLRGWPEFDISDDSYREMLATGALRTLRDGELRSAILAYYRISEDMGANVMTSEEDVFRLKDLLLESSVSIEDSLSFQQLTALVRQNSRLAAQGRYVTTNLRTQQWALGLIEDARVKLEAALVR